MTSLRRMGRILAATTTTALTLGLAPHAFAQTTVDFSVSNITDFHGRLLQDDGRNQEMGAALLAGLNDTINGPENVFTTSGDNVGGTAFISAITNDEYTIDFLNAAGVDVSAVGNHEFDQGQADLLGRIIPNSDFPILGANVYRADNTRLLDPYSIVERNGVKIGFVGTVATTTAAKVSPGGIVGLEFRDPVAETNKVAEELKTSGAADVVIALLHEDAEAYIDGFDPDHVDFVFGGDSHNFSRNETHAVPYAQSHEYGKMLTDVDFTFNTATRQIESVRIEQYDLARTQGMGVLPNQAVADIVEEAQAQSDEIGQEIVAETAYSFYRGSNSGGEPGSNRGVESTLNHLIAEAQRASMEEFLAEEIQVGFMNAGGVRADMEAGEVTYADANTVQPFGNEVSVATISGQGILDTLERQWQADENAEHPRLALGLSEGFSYTYDPTAPRMQRVIGATLHGQPIDPAQDYRIAASTFLFEGGDRLFEPADLRDVLKVGYIDVQAFIDYLKANEDVAPRVDQGDIGIVVNGELIEGQTVTLELSSLNYSNPSEPQAETVTVTLGDTVVTAPINNGATDGTSRLGEHGTASVELLVPAGSWSAVDLAVTTDAKRPAALPTPGKPGTPGKPKPGKPGKPNGSEVGARTSSGSSR